MMLPKNPIDLIAAYDDAADHIERRAMVLGLALQTAGAKARIGILEICFIASVFINVAAVGVIAALVLRHHH